MGALMINAYGAYAEIYAELMLQVQQHGVKPLRFLLLPSVHICSWGVVSRFSNGARWARLS